MTAAGSVQVAIAQVDTPSATLQPMDVLTGSKAWVLDAPGTALQRVNYSEEHWGDLSDSLAALEAAPDSANGRASLLRASHLVRAPLLPPTAPLFRGRSLPYLAPRCKQSFMTMKSSAVLETIQCLGGGPAVHHEIQKRYQSTCDASRKKRIMQF